jgi:hypothetical protein
LTVELASAPPVILGELLSAGPTGLEASDPGRAGVVESSTYVTELVEQPETLPAASVAVALKVVELSSETATVRPGLANAAAVPLAATEPEQSVVV